MIAKDYKGAEFRTIDSYTYGRFEVSLKPPAGSGVLASFFTYHEITSTAEWNEIDIEILGRYEKDAQFTTIIPGQIWRNSHQLLDVNPHNDFHTYAFEWTPDYVAWFFDGVEIFRQDDENIATLNHDQKIMMNIWNSEFSDWVGDWYDASLPYFAYYDWVSYYTYTPDSGNYGTDNNFSLSWRDDFDSWDEARWEKGTHTFSGNKCDFIPENAVLKDGKLILCLSDATHTGYQDMAAPKALWARFENDTLVRVRYSENIETSSAENTSTFYISGTEIKTAKLMPDQQTVLLSLSGASADQNYTLATLGLKDLPPGSNTQAGQVVSVFRPVPLKFPLSIDVGNPSSTSSLPGQYWSPEKSYGRLDGGIFTIVDDIGNTENDTLYQHGVKNLVKYHVDLPNGLYAVTLKFAEPDFSTIGERLFDIYLEGQVVVTNLDLAKEAGQFTAYDILIDNVAVSDGALSIHFRSVKDFAVLNGLYIEKKITGIGDPETSLPGKYLLGQNYPNPFNPSTVIPFLIKKQGYVNISVFNSNGQNIINLFDGIKSPGDHKITWNGCNKEGKTVNSGVYFYRLRTEDQTMVKKMLLLR